MHGLDENIIKRISPQPLRKVKRLGDIDVDDTRAFQESLVIQEHIAAYKVPAFNDSSN
jgi:hypothetical protein